ncbi:hypothetical protein ACFWRV_06945 [Streptomyces sp. NPDC058576]|uniref:hypothetical protein n=1 Tax=Streptomyces sp. NPDC058576 TaxID=3346547 RepID=UPI00364DA391
MSSDSWNGSSKTAAARPSTPAANRDRYDITHWLKQNEQPYYQQMKPFLDTYADQLIHANDTEHSGRQLTCSLAK